MSKAVRSRSWGRGRGGRGRVLACLPATAFTFLALASSASALSQRGHVFGGEIPSKQVEEKSAIQLKEPAGVAVNEATGDVYVVDAGNNRIVEFGPGPEHPFLRTWGWGVKNHEKAFQVCERNRENKEATATQEPCDPGLGGHARGQLHGAGAISIDQNTNRATDPSAQDVYVETVTPYEETIEGHEKEFANSIIEKFGAEGELPAKGGRIKGYKEKGGTTELFEEELRGLTVGPTGVLDVYNEESVLEYNDGEVNKLTRVVKSEAEGEGRPGIAVDSNGIFYLAHEGPGAGEPPTVIAKEKAFPEGETWLGEPLIEALTGEQSSAVAVDEQNNNVLVDNVESVGVFDASGELVERFGAGRLHGGSGIAALRSGEALVADAATGKVDIFEPEPPAAPQIDELSVEQITASSAVLTAQIDPTGLATTYTFRYDTGRLPGAGEPCSGACVEVPGPAATGAFFGDAPVSVPLSGLAGQTLYHYAVIATNADAPAGVQSAEQRFHTQRAVLGAVLPDGRRWELVSPLQKNGASIEAQTKEGGLIEASENGERLTYVATGAFPGAEGNRAPEVTQVLAARGETEWSNTDIDTPQIRGQGLAPGSAPEYRLFSSDLTSALVQPFGEELVALSPKAGESTPYVRSASGECLTPPADRSAIERGCFAPLLTSKDAPAGYGGQVNFVQADASLTHSILQVRGHIALSGEPVGATGNLYEYTAGQEPAVTARLVSILPNGEPAPAPQLGAQDRNIVHALSADGSRAIWTTYSVGQALHLYMRDMTKGETIQLDAPEAGAETTPKTAHPIFQGASADGSRIFFTDEQRLTTNSTASSESAKADLYVCQVVEDEATHKLGCELTDLSVDTHPGQPADVQGLLLGAGEQGNAVYFVANGALTSEAAPGHCIPNEESANGGKFRLAATCNLYVRRFDTESRSWQPPQLIAALSAEDEADWSDPIPADLGIHTARVSPDGNLLTFVSDRSLTGYVNRDVASGKPDTEVFLYNAGKEELTCVSCNPTGARPTGVFDTEFAGEGRGRLVDRPLSYQGRWLSGLIPAWTHLSVDEAPYASRVLFNDGRMFFTSSEALVPQDTNGKEDVYEFEPAGVGGCTTESETYGESSGGCVSLISSGTSKNESTFLDASANGNDVFILTSAQLSPADTDTSFDVYDATVCGQSGTHECLPSPAISPPACNEEPGRPCKAGATEPGVQFAAPGTAAAGGSGNSSAVEVLGSKETKHATPPPAPTLAQKLAKALTACHRLTNHRKRLACEALARATYRTRAQKLAAALKACHRQRSHARRAACEAQARRKYGPPRKGARATVRRGR